MISMLLHQGLLFLQVILLILLSPILIGWIQKVKYWCQQKSAPSVFLPYFTIYKLLIKQPVLAKNASWIFRLAPYIYIMTLILICTSLPFFMTQTLSARAMNLIVMVGLLTLARIFLCLGGMDVGTAFGNLGVRRDLFVSCLAEPILLMVFFNVALLSHYANLNQVVAYFLNTNALFPGLTFSLLALSLITIAETGRIPIDNPATHLELTMIHEAIILEYSGRYLALIEWGNAIKFLIYLTLMICLFMPCYISIHLNLLSLSIGLLASTTKLFLLATMIGFVESINSKLRIFKIPDYMASAFMLAILGVLITQLLGSQVYIT